MPCANQTFALFKAYALIEELLREEFFNHLSSNLVQCNNLKISLQFKEEEISRQRKDLVLANRRPKADPQILHLVEQYHQISSHHSLTIRNSRQSQRTHQEVLSVNQIIRQCWHLTQLHALLSTMLSIVRVRVATTIAVYIFALNHQ